MTASGSGQEWDRATDAHAAAEPASAAPAGPAPDAAVPGVYKIPILFAAQPEGGFVVTSPLLPELVTEAETVEEALANTQDALAAVVELYRDIGRPFPPNLRQDPVTAPIWFETAFAIT